MFDLELKCLLSQINVYVVNTYGVWDLKETIEVELKSWFVVFDVRVISERYGPALSSIDNGHEVISPQHVSKYVEVIEVNVYQDGEKIHLNDEQDRMAKKELHSKIQVI